MKTWIVLGCICLAGCSWFSHKKPGPPPSEYLITGAPTDAAILIDGAPQGQPSVKGKPQVVVSTSGYHLIEIKVGDRLTYREQTYLAPGERHVVKVLSADY